MLRALIWDIDGTVAETEALGHRVAFNRAFAEAGLPWVWGEAGYGRLLQVNGGRDRLLAFMQQRSDAPPGLPERQALVRSLHQRKNAIYAELVAQGHIAPRPGVLRLMDECRREGVALAIATTSVGGALLIVIQPVEPSIGREYIGRLFAICVLGGMGSFPGMLVAATILGVVESVTATFFSPSWAPAVAFGFLLLTLAVRPSGIFGR